MTFIETPWFTRTVSSLMSDDQYSDLQRALIAHPKKGDLIQGGGGLRKLRWASGSKRRGKRGGMRIIYYLASADAIYMLSAYHKSSQDDLTHEQLKMLRSYVKGSYETG